MNIEETNEEVVEETGESTAAVEENQAEESNSSDQEVIEKTLIDTDQEEEEAEKKDDDADAEGKEEEGSTKFEMPDLGEGVEFDTALFESMTPVLKEMNATQEQVQKLAEAYLGHVEKAAVIHGEAMIEKYNEIKDGWKTAAQEELGAGIKQDLLQTGNALKKFGSPALIELFNETGIGNHVEVIKAFSKIGKLFTEDNMVDGESKGGDAKAEDVMYPSMNK